MMKKREFVGANILEVSVETNCPQGGDAGHGGKTVLEIKDLGGTSMSFSGDEKGFRVEMGGDSECNTLIEALKFAASELEFQRVQNEKQGEKA